MIRIRVLFTLIIAYTISIVHSFQSSSSKWSYKLQRKVCSSSNKDFDYKDVNEVENKDNNLKQFKECADLGLEYFKASDLKTAISTLQKAVSINGTQPLG